jgi:hypothetical protein
MKTQFKKTGAIILGLSLFAISCKKNTIDSVAELKSSESKGKASTSSILWDGDASKGTGVFNSLEEVHGTIDVIDDATLGQKAFRFRVYNVADQLGSDRAESNGLKGVPIQNNTIYYLGWKQKYGNPFPSTTDWVNVFQWKAYPAVTGFNYPIAIRADGANLRVIYQQQPTGAEATAWALGSLPVNTWVSWILAIRTSPDPAVGYVEIWYNGEKKAKVFMKTFHEGSAVFPKWGVYRSARIDPEAETCLWRPRCGTSFVDVNPEASSKVSLHQNCSYGGWSFALGIGNYTMSQLQAMGFVNDDASSIKVPAGLKIQVYSDNNFAGSTATFTSDQSCLSTTWNDKISSLKVLAN